MREEQRECLLVQEGDVEKGGLDVNKAHKQTNKQKKNNKRYKPAKKKHLKTCPESTTPPPPNSNQVDDNARFWWSPLKSPVLTFFFICLLFFFFSENVLSVCVRAYSADGGGGEASVWAALGALKVCVKTERNRRGEQSASTERKKEEKKGERRRKKRKAKNLSLVEPLLSNVVSRTGRQVSWPLLCRASVLPNVLLP